MKLTTLLQIFILVDVFIIGTVTTKIIQHAKEHYRPKIKGTSSPEKLTFNQLPDSVQQRLLQAAQDEFMKTTNQSMSQLKDSLGITTEQVNTLIRKLATDVVQSELDHYHADLDKLHIQAEKDLGNIKNEMTGYEAQLKVRLDQELAIEKQRLVKQIDNKLGDAVASFLLEALQHNVDLGSQTEYLTTMLNEHKADFIKEVTDEN
jgi:DNA-binding Lrp family transcriptional regulator